MDEPMARLLRGVLMIGVTGIVQALAQLVLMHLVEVLPLPRASNWPKFVMISHRVIAVLVLMTGHLLQVALWALLYHVDWGEFQTFSGALYFSLASFTTVGANELHLSSPHRMVGALESAAGMLMFGWSTALLVKVVLRSERSGTQGETS